VSTIDANRKSVTITIAYGAKSISQVSQFTRWERDAAAGACSSSVPTLASSFGIANTAGDAKVQTVGDYAYVVSAGDDLVILDISDPQRPSQAGSLTLT